VRATRSRLIEPTTVSRGADMRPSLTPANRRAD
jgi:hypothetical protein